jgi:RimJ/RimL family protein N-acetyltransferase
VTPHGATGPPAPVPETDRLALLALYHRDPAVHPYGIADLEQLWSGSTWWRRGDAAVGLLDLPGSPVPVVYAVSTRDPAGTRELLAELDHRLPDRYVVTAPRGTSRRLAATRSARWAVDHVKMALRDPAALPPPDPRVVTLRRADLADLDALYATDADAGSFFHADLLDTGAYVGLRVDGRLVATAGVHVLDRVNGVAALGNVATEPPFRRRGFGVAVVATLCHRLRRDVAVVGLNVAASNVGARRLYEHLGFEAVAPYEEAELVRRTPAAPIPGP